MTETNLTSNLSPSLKDGGKHTWHRETNLTSSLSSSHKEWGKHTWHREPSLTSNLSPSHKNREKNTWHRQTSLTSNLSTSHTAKQWWGANREDPRPLLFWRQFLGRGAGHEKNLALLSGLYGISKTYSPNESEKMLAELSASATWKALIKPVFLHSARPPFSSRFNQNWICFNTFR